MESARSTSRQPDLWLGIINSRIATTRELFRKPWNLLLSPILLSRAFALKEALHDVVKDLVDVCIGK
jgi:hypothetical protein